MKRNYFLIVIMIVCNICITDALAGNFMQERDEYFHGARQTGMAGIGFSRPDDENAMFLNPAGLGIKSKRFDRMAIAYGNMFEITMQNAFLFQDHYIPFCFQSSKEKSVNGFGIQLESFSLRAQDEIIVTKWDPTTGTIVPTWESFNDNHLLNMWIVGYGKNLSFWNAEKHAFGISLMVRSMYETNFGNPVAELSLLADIGYTGSFDNGIHLGLTVKNIPLVKTFDRDGRMLTVPVNFVSAFGWYKGMVIKDERSMLSLFTEINYRFSREKYEFYVLDMSVIENSISYDYDNSHFFSGGIELGIAEILFIRNGFRPNFGNGFSFNKIGFACGLGVSNRKNFAFNLFYTFFAGNSEMIIQKRFKRFGCSVSLYI